MNAARTDYSPNAISKGSNAVINTVFWLYTIACVFPLLLVIVVSFTDEMSILKDGYQLISKAFSTMAYELLLGDSAQIVRSYGVSLFVTVVGTLLSLLLTAAFAYPISRAGLPNRNAFAFFIFFTMLFNGGLVPRYLVYVKYLHLGNTIWALIVPMLIQPFNVLIMRTFFQTTIPGAPGRSGHDRWGGRKEDFLSHRDPLVITRHRDHCPVPVSDLQRSIGRGAHPKGRDRPSAKRSDSDGDGRHQHRSHHPGLSVLSEIFRKRNDDWGCQRLTPALYTTNKGLVRLAYQITLGRVYEWLGSKSLWGRQSDRREAKAI